MKLNWYIYIFVSTIIICSCSSKKDIIYFQGNEELSSKKIIYDDTKIKVDHILKIDITAPSPDAVVQYNKTYSALSSNTVEMLKLLGYLVDNSGHISFPVLGKIKVSGLSVSECENFIYQSLLDGDHLINHNVSVKILNNQFTIIGEVKNPGIYSYYENNFNVINAIGMAGDLTINGERKDIKLIREVDGIKAIYNVDLTSKDLLSSESYQIMPGDIIVVNPNSSRVKNAGIIGNSGTLLSLLSFILSSIIVISR